ncbi:MAG TPA: hypothetical protein VGM54_09395 [Chthoniobacter sp.]
MFVKPPGPRHTTTELPDGVAICIPARRNIFILAFLTLWLCGWLMGEITAPIAFVKSAEKNPAAAGFLLIWISAWTLGGGFALLIWLWQVKGREIVTISPSALSIGRQIFGYGPVKHYDLSEIRDLRLAPFVYNPFDFRAGMAFWGFGGGLIAFDYGYKTFRFGAGIDEAEARIILQTITARNPRLVKASQ